MVERGPTQAWAPRTSTEDAQLKVKGREDLKRTVTPTSSDAATFATSLREAAAGEPGRNALAVTEQRSAGGRPSITSSDQGSRSQEKGGELVTSPSSSSVLHSYKGAPSTMKSKAKGKWKAFAHGVGRLCSCIAENKAFVFVGTFITVWALIGDDLKLLVTNRPVDNIFDGLVVFCIVFFTLEVLVCSLGKDDYFMSFFFCLDVLSTLTLFMDLTVVSEALFGDSDSDPSNTRTSRTARVGAKVGRIVRVLRLIRIVKLFKAFLASSKPKKKPPRDRLSMAEEDDDDNFPEEEEHFDKESLVGKKLSVSWGERQSHRQGENQQSNVHEPRCYWVPWRVRFGHSRANSPVSWEIPEQRCSAQKIHQNGLRNSPYSPSGIPGLNFYSHVRIILTIVRRRVGAAHLIVMRTAASFTSRKGQTDDEVRPHEFWSDGRRDPSQPSRSPRSRATTFCAAVEGDDDFEFEEDNGLAVAYPTLDTKGTEKNVQQKTTKSTALPADSLKPTTRFKEEPSGSSPRTPGSGRGLGFRSSRSSISSLSENARKAAATRAAMAGLNISMEDPDTGRGQGGVITRAVSRILRAGIHWTYLPKRVALSSLGVRADGGAEESRRDETRSMFSMVAGAADVTVLKLSFVAKSRTESKELRPATIRSTVQEFKEATADAAQQLEQLGFCFWRQGVSMDCCQRLARYVDEALLAAEAEVAAADQETRYARHRTYFRRLAHATRQDRIEFTLPMVPVVVDALKEMVASVGGLLEPFVSRSGRLVDLSCMISDPGCEFQPLHADTSMERVKFTVFVALQDVTKEMGPTFLCPETHNFESHAALDVMKKMPVPHEEMLERFGAVPALCNCGDIFIMTLGGRS
ncbi:unnamed protein product [Cladocopium goreaui]|uniref:Ion transport domain-containing protein n=1 Tax=Cladocopium goreaui TaxID=2562237 RepID=A0A9P1BZ81_9DINO|nr:unnamed protein product [Cladocopium goreaui]